VDNLFRTIIITLMQVCGTSTTACPTGVSLTLDACGICGGNNSSCNAAGVCGDSLCNAAIGENCHTCVLDYGYCGMFCKEIDSSKTNYLTFSCS
jgi:hypothetical protein